jgi:hypothetical protein
MPPTPQHEALHRIFTHDTDLFARTMHQVFGTDVPVPRHVSLLNTDYSVVPGLHKRVPQVHDRHGDSALLAELLVEGRDDQYVILVESQTDPDPDAEYRWPFYAAYLHDKYQCPVVLLVVTSKKKTARWARKPIKIGLPDLTCLIVHPAVLGPDNVAAITDPDIAEGDPGFAVFSAITHSRSHQIDVILETLAGALSTVDEETGSLLAEFTEAGLGDTKGRSIWRKLMATSTYPFASELRSQGREEGRAKGREEGRAEGRAEGVAEARAQDIERLLDKRGITMTPADRDRISSCRDAMTLDTWLDRVLTIADISELFAD